MGKTPYIVDRRDSADWPPVRCSFIEKRNTEIKLSTAAAVDLM